MEKKIRIAVFAAVFALIVLIGYVIAARNDERVLQARPIYASIVMPDGSIISGRCNGYDRNDRYTTVYLEDRVYKASDWRVVIWYDKTKTQ